MEITIIIVCVLQKGVPDLDVMELCRGLVCGLCKEMVQRVHCMRNHSTWPLDGCVR